jgi:hypothetical protein
MGSGAGLAAGFGQLERFGLTQPVWAGKGMMSISEVLPSHRLLENLTAFDRGAEAVERL